MAFLAAIGDHARGGLTPMAQLTASREFNRFLSVNNMTFDTESCVTWLLLEATDRALGAEIHVPRVNGDLLDMTARCVPAAAGAAMNTGALFNPQGLDTQVLQEGIQTSMFRSLLADRHKALYWLLDLVACHQVKPLKASNVSNFFRMNSRVTLSGREIMKVLDYAAVTLPNIMANDALVALMSQNQFMIYHTSYSSSAGLAQEMINSAPAITHAFFSENTRAAVDLSAQNPSNRNNNAAIPQLVLLATYAYLVAFNKLPDNWFQGEKAKTSLPASKYNVYLAIFRRVKALTADTDAIAQAADVNALVDVISADMRDV